MAIQGMTDKEVSMLTEEERAALEDDAPDPAKVDDTAKKAALAGGGTPDNPVLEMVDDGDLDAKAAADETDDDDDEAAAAAAKKGDGDAATEGEEGKPAVTEPPVEARERQFVPLLPVPTARDFDAEEVALVKKFEEGELTELEYSKAKRELSAAFSEAQHADKFNEAVQDAVWLNEQRRFLKAHPEYKQGTPLYAALDCATRLEGKAEGAEELSGDELLERADKRVKADYGLKVPLPGVAPVAPKKAGEEQARKNAPKTLGEGVPAADLADTGRGGRFAHLEQLDGLELENAIAKLSQADQDEYARAG